MFVAEIFSGILQKVGTLFIIEASEGRLIEDISTRKEEAEVLLQPNSEFIVMERVHQPDNITVIFLKQIPTQNPFKIPNALMLTNSMFTGFGDHIIRGLDKETHQIGNEELINAFLSHPTLTSLSLSYNAIKSTEIASISMTSSITTLMLNCCYVNDAAAKVLASNTTFTRLDLPANKIGDEGALFLVSNSIITSLTLHSNQFIGGKNQSAVNILQHGTKLSQNRTLTYLDLSITNTSNLFLSLLGQNASITFLNLDYNNIGDEGASILAKNSTIKYLRLRFNRIGDDGAVSLAQNNTLTSLDLRCNQIGLRGVAALETNNTILHYWIDDPEHDIRKN
eukprot:TRINITY_DN1754_c0_g1_i3.p1 TRINITY_DN1754_c0_g1~~TRINITY_DN1754_c0_g1_i3.p1  ORF type:complete len:338 (-),score=14.59 TRINITY_DN1754_c0_g1_i3:48-1061(-)